MHDMAAIMAAILQVYTLPRHGAHGVVHWARVLENGLRVGAVVGADPEVVALFALFHDSQRVNQAIDNDHGLRGARLAQSLRGTLIHLSAEQFEMLFEACRLHTDGLREAVPTIQACWDADRLDLGRVGIVPRPDLLCTDAARELLPWAHQRAVGNYEPQAVLRGWGV